MKNRESQLPDRPSVIRGQRITQRSRRQPTLGRGSIALRMRLGVFFLAFTGVLVALLLNWLQPGRIAHRVESPSKPQLQPLPKPDSTLLPGRSASLGDSSGRPAVGFDGGSNRQRKQPVPVTEVEPKANQAGELVLSLSKGFRPAGFKIGAVQKRLQLSNHPDRLFKRLPDFTGPSQKYGVITLGVGQQYRFVLDTVPSGYRLYLDRNRNGDLTDDGPPVENQGKGRFAATLSLPMDRVTGVSQLQGEYQLWVFANNNSWRQNTLGYYSRTQLQGRLRLGGHLFTAYLADNLVLDGDYRNDGISIDLDGDGKIDREREYLPPDEMLTLGGRDYRVKIVY
ncbi:MAG: hypothetical protein ABW116_03370 [Candidatus Sedimenticola sp. 20ELBAFRAG]